MLRAEVIDDLRELERLSPAWDELAVDAELPFCAPAWLLAWWRHVAPASAALRVAVAHEGEDLVGIAPFYVDPTTADYRPLGSGTSMRVEPLARAGREAEVAERLAAALGRGTPAPGIVRLEGVPESSPWARRLAGSWPGRAGASLHRAMTMPAPTIDLTPGREQWLATRKGPFRRGTRRRRNRLVEDGAVFRILLEVDELEGGIQAFSALHRGRWEARGGSGVMSAEVERMLVDAARELVPRDRLRLWHLELDGRPIAADIQLVAGHEVADWLGGFDEEWRRHQPALQTMLESIDRAFADEARRFDLGPGGQEYKYDLANDEELLVWWAIVPRGRAYPLNRARLEKERLRRELSERLPRRHKDALKRLLRIGEPPR